MYLKHTKHKIYSKIITNLHYRIQPEYYQNNYTSKNPNKKTYITKPHQKNALLKPYNIKHILIYPLMLLTLSGVVISFKLKIL